MITLHDRLIAAPDLMMADLEGEAVLLHTQSGRYFGLNEVATRIWELTTEPTPVHEVVTRLQSEYDIDPETLQLDVLRFAGELVARQLAFVAETVDA